MRTFDRLAILIVLVLGTFASASTQPPDNLKFSTPAGWKRVAPLSNDMIIAVQKGKSIFTVRRLDHRYTNHELEDMVKARRAKLAALDIHTVTDGLFTDPRGFIGFASWSEDWTTVFGNLATENASYAFTLQNSNEEEFKEVMSGITFPHNESADPVNSNPALRSIPRFHYALAGMVGNFPNPPGYQIVPVDDGGIMVKGDGFGLMLDPAPLEKFGSHAGEAPILNGSGQTIFDPKQCGHNGMIPVVHGNQEWLFRLFTKCAGESEEHAYVVGIFSMDRSEQFAIAGRAANETSIKAMLLWARMIDFQIPTKDVTQTAASYTAATAAINAGDFQRARELLQPLADLGFPNAEYNLAVMYDKGSGLAKDADQATAWYQKAADQGYALAEYNLGANYYNGYGTTKDYSLALKWFLDAAARGDASAEYGLGMMYLHGQGVDRSYMKAIKWFTQAAKDKKPIQPHRGD